MRDGYVRGYPDDVPVPSFGPRLRCERCGQLGADAQPNWNGMHKQEPIKRASGDFRTVSLGARTRAGPFRADALDATHAGVVV